MDKVLKDYNITVVGIGYVGISLGLVLSKLNKVHFLDINQNKVDLINKKESPIFEEDIESFIKKSELRFCATVNNNEAFEDADFVVIATPTNYVEITKQFDTVSVDSVVENALSINPKAFIVIKSTIPFGHTNKLRKKYNTDRIIFSPEFLREGKALHDNLYPSRIIVGDSNATAYKFAQLLKDSAIKKDIPILFMNSSEAESVKLFANTYLVMRVAFFNELDNYAIANDLDTKNVIDGMCLDERIGATYNNPSFGYGGYCLPKDTKQLQSNFDNISEALISAVITSNSLRKDFIYKEIINLNPKVLGVYRLIMKKDSDNYRSSAIFDIFQKIIDDGIKVIIYEPIIESPLFNDIEVVNNLKFFKESSDLIITNRYSAELDDVKTKVYTRDIYGEN